jgi:hypothetical protein
MGHKFVGWAKALFAPCPPLRRSWWARHRARIRAARWLCQPYALSAESGEPVTLPLNNRALSAVQDLYRKFRTPA